MATNEQTVREKKNIHDIYPKQFIITKYPQSLQSFHKTNKQK